MKAAMQANLTDHYRGSVMKLLSKAAFLDPRSKVLSFLLNDDRLDVIASVKAKVVALAQSIASQESEFNS